MNNIINISERLKCAASLVNKGARVADIGTDHAYLPIYLVQNGISNKVYACDVRKEPLRRAQLHIDEYGLSDKITTQLCDAFLLWQYYTTCCIHSQQNRLQISNFYHKQFDFFYLFVILHSV